MKPVSLNDYLNANNVWTDKLLGDQSTSKKIRTIEQIENEYNLEVYGKRLEVAQQDLESYRTKSLYAISSKETYVAIKDSIYLMPFCMLVALKRNKILEQIEKYCKNEYICELGAGNGQNMIWLKEYQDRNVYGGEYSKNAVKLAKMLGFEMYDFNYYEQSDYDFIKDNSSIITVHSIEQIPDATVIINSLRKIKHKLKYILHFEPIYNDGREDLIGLLRNKYLKINDYNLNLLDLLRTGEDIEIVHTEFDAFGNNPLNPTSIIVWKFI
ncbi:MAG: hypothetical protein HYV06_02350 [Deltaproteobacteria bacterium]|nr:hypothetical protein [Deltaproteobacteria bacterium]